MSKFPYFLLSRILLNFEARANDVVSDISAAAFSPDGYLWVGSDEMIGVERLEPIGGHSYGKHRRFLLQDYIDLFNTDEIDIEGMDYADGYLWLIDSTFKSKIEELIETVVGIKVNNLIYNTNIDTNSEALSKQVDYLNSIATQKNSFALKKNMEVMEFKIDSLVDDLDTILLNLFTFDGKLKNVIALREKLEAIQEERIDGITPERIYKLLAKEQRHLQDRECISISKFPKNNIWQKLRGWNHNLREPKIAIVLVILASLSLGWTVGYHSSTNLKLNDNQTVESTKKLNNS